MKKTEFSTLDTKTLDTVTGGAARTDWWRNAGTQWSGSATAKPATNWNWGAQGS